MDNQDFKRFLAEKKDVGPEEGLFNKSPADELPNTLPPDVQKANVELALASMVAGSVVTFLLVAIVWTFCIKPNLKLPETLQKLLKKREKKDNKPPTVTSRDSLSVVYEDIEGEEDILNAGYVAPEVRSSHPYNPVASSNTSVYPCQPAVTPQPVCTPKTTSSAPKIMITAYTAGDQESTSHSPVQLPVKMKSGFKVIPKPMSSSLEVSQKPFQPTSPQNDSRKPLQPKKPTRTVAEEEGYIHPISTGL